MHALLACLLVMAVSGGYAMYAPSDAPNIAAHPDLPAMAVGGDGAARFAATGWAVFVFQCASLVAGPLLMTLGVRPERRTALFKLLMAGSTACMLVVWIAMFFTYRRYLATGETAYVLGFPVPTAWMIYGTWIGALSFIFIFCLGFRVFVLPKEDEAAFEALAAELRTKQQRGGA